ncbi:MAG: GMP synthase, partial [Candidatus Thalassarchaeaceae archaeon]|nr:GMP synthase [Candidatus Thalassarchaeaceae archaeon]
FMAGFYGGGASEAPAPEFGAASITLVNGGGKIFEGTPDSQVVWESHNDEVSELPEGFFITASSESCVVQGMENESGDRFGLQFHPEVNDSEYGQNMFQNFIEICRKSRDSQ